MSDSTKSSRGEGLAAWTLGPVLGLMLFVVVLAAVPAPDCSRESTSDSPREVVFLLAIGFASLVTCAFAALRLAALWRKHPRRVSGNSAAFIAVAIVSILLLAICLPSQLGLLLIGASMAGLLVTGIALLALLAAWARGVSAEGAGWLLPVYLLGIALLCYPAAAFASMAINNGALC